MAEAYKFRKLSLRGRAKTLQLIAKYKYTEGHEVALRGLQESYEAEQFWAETALEQIINPTAIPILIKLYIWNNDQSRVKWAANKLMDKIGIGGFTELVNLIDVPVGDSSASNIISEVLTRIARFSSSAVPQLNGAIYDLQLKSETRTYLVQSLRAIGTPEALAAVEQWERQQRGGQS